MKNVGNQSPDRKGADEYLCESKMRCIVIVLLLFIAAVPLPAQDRPVPFQVTDDEIVRDVTRLLRWNWYWENLPLEEEYLAGKKTEIAVIESPEDIQGFLREGVGIRFHRGRDGKVRFSRNTWINTDIPEWVKFYIKNYHPRSSAVPGTERRDFAVNPAFIRDTVTAEEKERLLKIRSIPFTLPKLTPPDSILKKQRPSELRTIEAKLPEALADCCSENCGKTEVLIPYFSPDDPWVYVYAKLCGWEEGIIYFNYHENDDKWYIDHFRPNRAPDDFSGVIKKIRSNAAAQIEFPMGVVR